MTPQEKQAELNRYNHTVLSTLAFLVQRYSRIFVSDGQTLIQEYYDQQKRQAEKYYAERRLNRLKQQLNRLTEALYSKLDLQFDGYIKENTNNECDIFEQLKNRVANILSQKKISTTEESKDAKVY